MRNTKIVLLALLCALPISSETVDGYSRFQLFNACRPVMVRISSMDPNIRRHLDSLRPMVESRLQSARLYTENPVESRNSFLDVRVTMIGLAGFGPAYIIDFQYKKFVTDEYGESFHAATWPARRFRSGHGTYGNTAYIHIKSSLASFLDLFLAEYLRVNESACESR